ncbi:MAG: DUF1684 domain-containing protein [Candidatus Limnocylindrales bacterium]
MTSPGHEYLELLDWRRRVSELWARWRSDAARDPAAATAAFRRAKDDLFRTHPQSPLPAADRAGFPGLAYWDHDPTWRLTGHFEPLESTVGPHEDNTGMQPIALPSSGPGPMAMRRVGRLALSGRLAGRRLGAFWLEGYGGGLFVPCLDQTSGHATYGAGRYLLDTLKSADHGVDAVSGDLVVDMNMAFHPSCAYDPRWACPLAPSENRLPVEITAGERLAS